MTRVTPDPFNDPSNCIGYKRGLFYYMKISKLFRRQILILEL